MSTSRISEKSARGSVDQGRSSRDPFDLNKIYSLVVYTCKDPTSIVSKISFDHIQKHLFVLAKDSGHWDKGEPIGTSPHPIPDTHYDQFSITFDPERIKKTEFAELTLHAYGYKHSNIMQFDGNIAFPWVEHDLLYANALDAKGNPANASNNQIACLLNVLHRHGMIAESDAQAATRLLTAINEIPNIRRLSELRLEASLLLQSKYASHPTSRLVKKLCDRDINDLETNELKELLGFLQTLDRVQQIRWGVWQKLSERVSRYRFFAQTSQSSESVRAECLQIFGVAEQQANPQVDATNQQSSRSANSL